MDLEKNTYGAQFIEYQEQLEDYKNQFTGYKDQFVSYLTSVRSNLKKIPDMVLKKQGNYFLNFMTNKKNGTPSRNNSV